MLHKKTRLAVAASHETKPPEPTVLYYGPDPDTERHRFKNEAGQKCLLTGAAYKLVTRMDGNGKRTNKRKLVGVTPGWVSNPDTDASFLALGSKSGQRVRLIGTVEVLQAAGTAELRLKNNAPQTAVAKEAAQATVTPSTVDSVAAGMAGNTPTELVAEILDAGCDKPTGKPLPLTDAELTAFKRELEVINAQRAAGLDPNVRIPTMEIMSQRSHASIYRDVKKTVLPKPIKIGSRSFFPLSVVLAYTAGQVCGGAA